MPTNAVELWSIASSIVAILLGVLAILLSVYFFVVGRRTEREASNSLAKIETQADMLQKLAGRQLDRLTRFVTEDRPRGRPPDSAISRGLYSARAAAVGQLRADATAAAESGDYGRADKLLHRLVLFSGVANYWAQQFLPSAAEFDERSDLQVLAKKVVDSSANDFNAMAAILERTDAGMIAANPLTHTFKEARDLWRTSVRTAAEVFVARERGA
jgi:hypothetical protein